ncbi:tetraspanin-3 [Cajanus cajan]|uniref:Tetraspanin-3 n=1 Tax=Cajanus cajan TaxID=3821 RepID=A0A151SUY8_CAJCA|nr:tetraspanin-3 [Cajanus cajan]KYP58621.1 hypothetical protein KK1_014036 [Cajanus cajan]
MRSSNHLIGLLNFLTFLLSFPILGGGIWLSIRANNTECLKFLQWPLIIIALCIMATSLAGLTGSCYRNPFLMILYLVLMFFIIILLIGIITFAYAVTDKGSGREVQNRVYLEYYLQDYEGWLEKRVASDRYWTKVRSCVRDSKVCAKLRRKVPQTADMFYHTNLSPIQSGCCKPPTECGYAYQNETMWSPEGGVIGTSPDCSRWSNDQNLLCYECDSCKAGVLATLKKSWRKVSVINIVLLISLLIVYAIAYKAYTNNRKINNCEPCGETRMIKLQPS